MSATAVVHDLRVRWFEPDDEPRVLDLLTAALGPGPIGGRTTELFAWKHRHSPFGPSLLLVAEAGGRIVGLRAFMRWRFAAGGDTVTAVRAVDTATHPEHRRAGVFSRLTAAALEQLEPDVGLVFNTPNPSSLAGYRKLGWTVAGPVPVLVGLGRPWRRRRPAIDAEPAAAALAQAEPLSLLLAEAREASGRLATVRDADYLRWRFARAPERLGYRAVREESDGRLDGIALFRVRRRGRLWETTIAELVVRPGDRMTARRLLSRVARAAAVDHLLCSCPAGSTAAREVRRRGFVQLRRGPVLAVRSLRGGADPDPADLRSWALSVGDLEVL